MTAELAHRRIQDDEVIERYVLGTLAPEERDAFEEHLVACADCAAQVLWTTDFRAALARDAALRAASGGATVAVRHPKRPLWVPLAASVVGLSWLGLASKTWELGRTVERSQTEAESWRQRYERERPSRQPPNPPAPADPVVNVPSLQLVSVRGEAPAQQIALPPDAPWLLLSLELDLEPQATYSARLTTGAGVPVWAGSGLRPVSPSLLSTLLPTRLLVEGDYVVAIENASAPAGAAPLGRYSFRLTRQPGNSGATR